MECQQNFGKNFKSEIRNSKPYLILGTVMYLITMTVAYGIMSTFQGATFSLDSRIIFTALRDYLVIPGIFVLFSFTKALWNTRRKKQRDS